VDGFQPIPGIRQGARHDHAHRVIEIGIAHLGIYINLLDITAIVIGLNAFFSHNFLSPLVL
jgi:hypothetical protein